ncbi:MAG: right-handed parallel beta-helix repeat-containing protein [Bryobacteraceae bacterium]
MLRIALLLVFSVAFALQAAPRTITVAQSAPADVVGADSAALQKAAQMLNPGDTLVIGPGTYEMNNSLFVPSGVTVRGTKDKTILKKSRGVESALAEDGDYGESALAVAEPQKFRPGMGVSIVDDKLNSGWDITVTSVADIKGPYLILNPITVRDYDQENLHAKVRNVFPILAVMNAANVTLEDITVDGNKDENAYIDGCRGGAIYLYNVRDIIVRNCTARNYNGDGISFQITENVQILNCDSFGHTGYGVHPGTGSARPLVKGCRLHNNGQIGLFLCWRVRHGRFEDNSIEDNGRYGISIGHKDTDNEFLNNTVARNGSTGVYFRKESPKNSGHRNVFRNNTVVDNGNAKDGYGFYISDATKDIVIEKNKIADTRKAGATQKVAIFKTPGAGAVASSGNDLGTPLRP